MHAIYVDASAAETIDGQSIYFYTICSHVQTIRFGAGIRAIQDDFRTVGIAIFADVFSLRKPVDHQVRVRNIWQGSLRPNDPDANIRIMTGNMIGNVKSNGVRSDIGIGLLNRSTQ